MNLNDFLKNYPKNTKDYTKEFLLGAKWALEPLPQFFLHKVPEITGDDLDLDDPGTFSFQDFITLMDNLQNTISQAKKKTLLYEAAQKANVREWNYFYRKILLKQEIIPLNKFLRITKNTDVSYEGFHIPSIQNNKRKLKNSFYIEPLYERYFVLLNKDSHILIYNNNFKLLEGLCLPLNSDTNGNTNGNTSNLFNLLMTFNNLLLNVPDSIVFEGFLTQGDLCTFSITDVIPYDDFLAGNCQIPLYERQELLEALVGMVQEFCRVDVDGESIPCVRVEPKLYLDLGDPRSNPKFDSYKENVRHQGVTQLVLKRMDSLYGQDPKDPWLLYNL